MKTKAVSNIPSSPPEEAEPWLLVPVAGSEPWPGSCGTDGAAPWSRDGCCEVAEEGAVEPGRRCPRVAGRPTWSGTPESGSAGKADRLLAAADVGPSPESGTSGSRIAARPACGRRCRGVAGRAVAVGSKRSDGRGVALVVPLSPGMAVGVGGAASMDVGEASKELGASDAASEAVPAETDGAVAGTDAVSLVISSVDGPAAPLAWPVETVSGGCGGRGVTGGIAGSPGGTVEADPTAACSAAAISSIVLPAETVVVCVTAPSSPGLRIRTEIEMLQPEQLASSPGVAAPASQFQSQFQTH